MTVQYAGIVVFQQAALALDARRFLAQDDIAPSGHLISGFTLLMRIAWLTDIHLNFLLSEQVLAFLQKVRAAEAEAIILSGDIAEAHNLRRYLELIDTELQLPVYFVLGNHDFYHGSIRGVRQMVAELCQERPRLHYLSLADEPLSLTPQAAVVGHDGWADGRLGNYETSLVQMTDWQLIANFTGHGKLSRWSILQELADEAAAHLHGQLAPALKRFEQVLVVTHVPPLREACWHEGRLSDDQWMPHFTCKVVGDVLVAAAREYPHRRITVYCGHTHGSGQCQPLPNLTVYTGGAVYGEPHVQGIIEV